MVGTDPGPALRLARDAADELGLPLMVHVIDMRPGHWPLPDAAGETETVEQLLVPRMFISSGEVREISSPVADSMAASAGS